MSEIILIYPGEQWIGSVQPPYPPLPLLPIAGALESNGFKVRLIDMQVENYKTMKLGEALYVGITTRSGRQISHGLEVAKFVREKDSELPIIWGGIHPSLLPEQTLMNEYVDLVVRGEGDLTIVELTKKLERGESIKNIKGISFKEKGRIIHNPARSFMNLDDVCELPYHLLKNVDAYRVKDVFHYMSSRGCPHRCAFCYNSVYCKNTWRQKSTKKVLEDLEWVINKFKTKVIGFFDDEFFVNKERVKEICTEIIKRKIDIEWSTTCRINYVSRYDSEFMKLLKKSGCKTLSMGVESGSQRILDFIKKDIKVNQVVPAIKKCKRFGIKPHLFFMTGFPTETKEELFQTMSLINKIWRIDKTINMPMTIFSPYPGTELYDISIKYGLRPLNSLEEWGRWNISSIKNTPWIEKSYQTTLETIVNTARLRSPLTIPKSINQFIRNIFVLSANLRWKYNFFNFPLEWKLWAYIQKSRGYA